MKTIFISGFVSWLFAIRWSSVTNRSYFVQRASGSSFPWSFQTVATNIPGAASVTTYTNMDVIAGTPVLFRVGTYR